MTQAEMYLKISLNHQLKFGLVKSIVDDFFEMMKQELIDGGRVQIHGLGVFDMRTIKERNLRNPRTGEPLPIPETKRICFKQSRTFREKLNAR